MLSNNLQISNVSFQLGTNYISFDMSWDNSWRSVNGDFHDAIWIFVKYRPALGHWQHADLLTLPSVPSGMEVYETGDNKGIFVRRNSQNTGNGNLASATYTFEVIGALGSNPSFKVFGIEMVHIPQGAFYMGGISNLSNAQYLLDSIHQDAVLVSSEGPISGSVYNIYTAGSLTTDGVDIPANFPKGYDAFYCMKYRISQEQYAEFLNTLTSSQQQTRVEAILPATDNSFVMSNTSMPPTERNSIFYNGIAVQTGNFQFGCDLNNNGTINEADDGQNLYCNFLSGGDVLAYLDWAALRPMTQLEVWKLCRGPLVALSDEHAWGSSIGSSISLDDIKNLNTDSEQLINSVAGPLSALTGSLLNQTSFATRCGMFATDTSTRIEAGASYYGVLDFSTSSYEISYGVFQLSLLLNYDGAHGNGLLSSSGDSDIFQAPFAATLRGGNANINSLLISSGLDRSKYISGRGVRTAF